MQEETLVQVMQKAAASPAKTPNISPFKGATLTVLRFLFINGSGYSAQMAKQCKLTPARVCQVVQDLEAKGLIASSSKVMDCSYCASTGRKNYGTKDAQCIYCSGSGRIREKTYPVIYRIRDESKPAVSSVFNAIYEINMLSRPTDTA